MRHSTVAFAQLGCMLALIAFVAGCAGEPSCQLPDPPDRITIANPRWDPALRDIVAHDDGEAWLTPYFVYGTNLAVPMALLLVLLGQVLLSRRQLRAARTTAERARRGELAAGAAVLHGTVAAIDDERVPVRLTITQVGVERAQRGKNSTRYTTKWTEVERALHARPFRLRGAWGEVRVEPGEQLYLVDTLETRPHDGVQRTREAEIRDGDEIYAFGSLNEELDPSGGAYRGGGRVWVLRPPRVGSMQLSARPLSEAAVNRMAGAIGAMLLLLVATAVAQLCAATYHVAVAKGVDEAAVIVGQCTRSAAQKKNQEHFVRYEVLSTGERLFDQVSESDYPRLTAGTVVPVNVVRWGSYRRVTLGAGAVTYAVASLLPLMLMAVSLGIAIYVWRGSRPWYQRARIDDVVNGRIGEPQAPAEPSAVPGA
jgi:hypothetical protein